MRRKYLLDKEIEVLIENATLLEQKNNLIVLQNLKEARRRVRELEDMYLEMKTDAEPHLMELIKMFGGGHEAIKKLFALIGIHPAYSTLELPPEETKQPPNRKKAS